MAILALFNVHTHIASAAENYFTTHGDTLALDELDPEVPDNRLVTVRLKAAREMTLHSLHGFFTPVTSEDEELSYYGSWINYGSGISSLCYSMEDGEFDWNTIDCDDEGVGDEGLPVQAGDTLIYATYVVKDDVDVMRRNMPVKIELAVVGEGGETGKHIENVTMDAYVIAGHDISVYKYITGNGDLDVPSIVIGGTEVMVGIIPDSGYELVYLELNGQEVTNQVRDNVFIVIPGTESLTFYATFQRVYDVLEGDGAEHLIGSDEALTFKIDNDLTDFCDQGLIFIDGKSLDMRYNCIVDVEKQTITLPASFLNTLGLGEHTFEAYFSEPETGNARATFKIVEEKVDPVTPNAGISTSEGSSAEIVNDFIPVAVVIGIFVVTRVLRTKETQEKRS